MTGAFRLTITSQPLVQLDPRPPSARLNVSDCGKEPEGAVVDVVVLVVVELVVPPVLDVVVELVVVAVAEQQSVALPQTPVSDRHHLAWPWLQTHHCMQSVSM